MSRFNGVADAQADTSALVWTIFRGFNMAYRGRWLVGAFTLLAANVSWTA
ncbi:MAG TPA: hypothetical protein VGO61_15215 [Steroidobacteraceae bacterium]|nr:hypothetical protein [Steroidobacteraceae bacterium]